ncbi:MAG: hypothetical protein HKL96_06145 [Phycisphaerales bacterium]|nr:hypothetical protein [Phycisphaerales bacterium]
MNTQQINRVYIIKMDVVLTVAFFPMLLVVLRRLFPLIGVMRVADQQTSLFKIRFCNPAYTAAVIRSVPDTAVALPAIERPK